MAYNKDIVFPLVISQIEEGFSLRSILRSENMPSRYTFFEWIKEDECKANQYARACETRAEVIFEEILDIADGTAKDTIYTDKGEIPNSEWIARSRLRVDSRKWMLGKMNPKKYGDKIQQELSGAVTQNIISLGSGIKPDETFN
jgi:hypothetical protein